MDYVHFAIHIIGEKYMHRRIDMIRIISKNLALNVENINSIEFSPVGFGKFEINFKEGNPITVYRTDPAFEDLENFLGNKNVTLVSIKEIEDELQMPQVRRRYISSCQNNQNVKS